MDSVQKETPCGSFPSMITRDETRHMAWNKEMKVGSTEFFTDVKQHCFAPDVARH